MVHSVFQRYICNVKFAIVLIIGVIVAGGIGYYVYANQQNDQNQNDPSEHTEASLSQSNRTNDDINAPIIFPKVPIWVNNEEVEIYREYLRIPTVHPDVDYKPAVAFLERQAASVDLPMSIYYPVDADNPVVVMTWKGSQPELESIMLNSHMDVVPVFEEFWTHPPFAAEMEENGDIYARGAQDVKSNGMQYLATIRALKRQGIDQLKRTVHVVFVPDEELGGGRGMAGFVKSFAFKDMNVAFMLDEGNHQGYNDDKVLHAFYGERTIWKVKFIVQGQSGHGSLLLPNTPGEKLTYLLTKLNEFRNEEMRKLNELKYPYGNLTSINLTIMKGGVQNNVVPAEVSVLFDMRISVNTDLDEFEKQLIRWCEEVGGNIKIEYLDREQKEKMTVVNDSNPYWKALRTAVEESGFEIDAKILTGGSDSRFIRRLNISAIGFSPRPNTISRLHDHNEYLNAGTYLRGIDIFTKVITNLGSV